MADNKLQSLIEIFNERFFRIPDFQRGYSWNKSQLEDFWEDLINLKDGNIHYTGLLTVKAVKKKSVEKIEKWQEDLWLFERGFNAYYLIDGQQRLTTSIILINELLNKFDDDKGINFNSKLDWSKKFLFQSYNESYKSYIFGYEKDNPSDEYFKTKILKQESFTSNSVPEETLYTANLKDAKDFFSKMLVDLEIEQLESIFKKLTTSFKYNLYEIDNELDIFVTFETMNNRGKSLSNLELLKNRLIYISTLINIDDKEKKDLRKDINEVWKTVYEYLGKNKNNAMDDDEFLRNHWIMYFKYNRKESASYAKFLLNQKFTAKNALSNGIGFGEINDYIKSLASSVKSWFYLYNPEFSNYSDETKEWLQKLNRLGMSAFPPLLMASMTKCTEKEFFPLLKSSEKFIFLVFRLSQRPANTKNNHFFRLANSFYFAKDNTTIESVIKNIDLLTIGDDENWGWFDLNKFNDYIKEQHEKKEGFYSWNGLRYFLFEYELDLQSNANGNIKISWNDFNKRKKEDTIEHIYPQTAKEKCWTSAFEKRYKAKNKKIMLHSLGNLLLLSRSKNAELQNYCFDFKKKHSNKKGVKIGFFNGSYSEIEVSSYSNWTPSEILERGMKMLDFLEYRWGIDFNDGWNIKKKELLQLKFLKDSKRYKTNDQ